MIIGTGIDSVETKRFALWYQHDKQKLLRIFSEQEIEYCLSNIELSAQRFAVRFAAREALFKAISAHWPDHSVPFLTLCRTTTIIKKRAPHIIVDNTLLQPYGTSLACTKIHLSLTHTQQTATAFVILEAL